jgi:hypothetical protein
MNKHIDLLKKKKKELDKQIKKEESRKSTKKGTLKFYEYTQNNSGGRFEVDKKICHRVIIQAHNEEEARQKALELGIYFDGCSNGYDCSCCGDRWSDYPSKIEIPYRYGTLTLKEARRTGYEYKKTTWKGYKGSNPNPKEYDLIFNSIIEYAQYHADSFSWTNPDVRIFYYNGKVVEIRSKNKNWW